MQDRDKEVASLVAEIVKAARYTLKCQGLDNPSRSLVQVVSGGLAFRMFNVPGHLYLGSPERFQRDVWQGIQEATSAPKVPA